MKDHYFRGFHLAQVVLYPVRYQSRDQKLEVAQSVDVSISVRPTTAEEEAGILRIKRPEAIDTPTHALRSLWSSKVVNPDEFDIFYPIHHPRTREQGTESALEYDPFGGEIAPWPSSQGIPADYIIIYDDRNLAGDSIGDVGAMIDYFLHEVPIAFADSISLTRLLTHYPASDPSDAIHQYVLDAIEEWGTLYFLLAGDVSVIPTRRLGAPDFGDHTRMDPPSDIYYTMMGSDWNINGDGWYWEANSDIDAVGLPQASIGRLPIRNAWEAGSMFYKSINYTYATAPPAHFETATLIAGPAFSADPNQDICGYKASEKIRDHFIDAWSDTSGVVRLYGRLPEIVKSCNGVPAPCFQSLDEYLDDRLGAHDESSWDEFEMFDVFNGNSHFVWHAERGTSKELGTPSWKNTNGATWLPSDGPCGFPHVGVWRDDCADAFEAWATSSDHWHACEPMTTAMTNFLDPAYGRYSIVMSTGWSGAAIDQQSIGESLLQRGSAGAVAFIGKTQNVGMTPLVDMAESFLTYVFDYVGIGLRLGPSWLFSVMDALGTPLESARWGSAVPLLGDPGMTVWSGMPGIMHASLPTAIGSLGPQSISITIREDNAMGAPIENAVVGLRQGSVSRGRTVTDASGVAHFAGFAVLDTTDIQVCVTAPLRIPVLDTLAVSNSASSHLVYEGHLLDDSGADGDGDGVLERGEAARVRVVWKNKGTTSATGPVLSMRPSPAVVLSLAINDEFRPDDIHIGKQNARPVTAAADSFRIPLSWEGFTVHGEPTATLSAESFKVWRENSTGRYAVGAVSPSGSADSVFTGVIKTAGGFSNVSMTGESGTDQYYASADSIWFSFHGDATEDRIYFHARADDWVGVTTPSQLNPSVAAGDTIGLWFDLDIKEGSPDWFQLPFTVTAQHNGTVFAHSDLSLELHGPRLEVLVVEWEEGGTAGSDTTVVIRPVLRNLGKSEADSAVVTLRLTGGVGTVLDSIATFGMIARSQDSLSGDSIVVAAADSAALANLSYELEVRTLLPQSRHQEYEVAIEGGGGGGTALIPQNLVATPEGRAIRLRWEPVDVTIPGGEINRYLVYLRDDSQVPTAYEFVGEADGVSTFEVNQIGGERLEPLDSAGDPIDYEFVVRACNDVYCGPRSDPSTERSWLPEMPGFPAVVPDVITTAPLVITLNGRDAVFVAGRAIWAWWLDDGTPVSNGEPCAYEFPEHPSGLFYLPDGTDQEDDYLESRATFAETLVQLDLPQGGGRSLATSRASACMRSKWSLDCMEATAQYPFGSAVSAQARLRRRLREWNQLHRSVSTLSYSCPAGRTPCTRSRQWMVRDGSKG